VGYIKGSNNIDRKWNKVFKSMTPSLFYTKELVNSSIVDGLDLIFENNLEEHRKRVKDRYSK
jgi:diacylglycerol kinase